MNFKIVAERDAQLERRPNTEILGSTKLSIPQPGKTPNEPGGVFKPAISKAATLAIREFGPLWSAATKSGKIPQPNGARLRGQLCIIA